MQLLLTSLLAAAAVAAPSVELAPRRSHNVNIPDYVQIVGYKMFGKGCPNNTYSVDLLNNNTIISLTYSSFEVNAGGQYADPSFTNTNCVARLQLKYPKGWRWTVANTDIDFSLHMTRNCTAQMLQASYFAGGDKNLHIKKQKYYGTTSRDFAVQSFPGDATGPWSGCSNPNIGQPPEFLITTAISLQCVQGYNDQGSFTIINSENDLGVRVGLDWHRC